MGLKIAQVAPYENVPPEYYGVTECVLPYRTEELVRKSQAMMFLARGDSETKAQLEAACLPSLRLDTRYQRQTAKTRKLLEVA